MASVKHVLKHSANEIFASSFLILLLHRIVPSRRAVSMICYFWHHLMQILFISAWISARFETNFSAMEFAAVVKSNGWRILSRGRCTLNLWYLQKGWSGFKFCTDGLCRGLDSLTNLSFGLTEKKQKSKYVHIFWTELIFPNSRSYMVVVWICGTLQ